MYTGSCLHVFSVEKTPFALRYLETAAILCRYRAFTSLLSLISLSRSAPSIDSYSSGSHITTATSTTHDQCIAYISLRNGPGRDLRFRDQLTVGYWCPRGVLPAQCPVRRCRPRAHTTLCIPSRSRTSIIGARCSNFAKDTSRSLPVYQSQSSGRPWRQSRPLQRGSITVPHPTSRGVGQESRHRHFIGAGPLVRPHKALRQPPHVYGCAQRRLLGRHP